jgi:beta-lactamase regulating signal transducer with metallopeptidase domain
MISEIAVLMVRALVRAEIAVSAAILLVLLLRRPARRLLGAGLAYRLWSLPLAAVTASLFPSLSEMLHGPSSLDRGSMGAAGWGRPEPILAIWLCGALLVLAVMAVSEVRFRRRASQGLAGPAIVGLGWRRLVIPSDFRTRFTEAERDFILRHERAHIARGDPEANLVTALLQAACWFNPLAHIAAACARLDQELACDETVIRDRPDLRRGYAETLLKAQLPTLHSPFACAFTGGRHPLELRLAMLARPQPGLGRYLTGVAAVAAIGLLTAAAVWAASPGGETGVHLPLSSLHAVFAIISASG